jgi:outer membrane biosynthesis protein TonB
MSTANRNVRLGVVYRGSIVHEEVLDRRIDVTIGLRAGSTVQISAKEYPEFPDSIELLAIENNQYYLLVPSDPTARVSVRGTTEKSAAMTVRGKRAIAIENAAGGSLSVGDVTIMFQFVRADTTPTITRESNVLRVGLVYDERLISDRVFDNDKQITIGNQKNLSVVLPEEDYQGPPIKFTNNRDGSFTLKAPATMRMRVATDGGPLELKELLAKAKARQEGNDAIVHLPLNTRGRVVMGEHTVLFQVIKQTVTVPMFPPKTLGQRIVGPFIGEPTWTVSFLAALLLIGAIVGQALLFQSSTGKYLEKTKPEDELARGPIEIQIEQKEEPPKEEEAPDKNVPEAAPIQAPAEKKPSKDDKKDAKAPDKPDDAEKKPTSTGQQVDAETQKRNDREVVVKNSVAGALMGANGAATKLFADDGGDGEGTVTAKFGGSAGDADSGGPGKGGLNLEGGGKGGGTIEKVKGKGGGFGERKTDVTKVEEPKKAEVAAKVSLGGLDGSDDGDGSKGDIAKKVASKAGAVKACYEAALRDNPDVSGKVKVSFTVGTAGTVTDVTVSGADGGFRDCIEAKFKAIRGLPILSAPKQFSQSFVFTKS